LVFLIFEAYESSFFNFLTSISYFSLVSNLEFFLGEKNFAPFQTHKSPHLNTPTHSQGEISPAKL